MPPNVVVIVIDALRTDRVGIYDGKPLTPNIDELADDAVVCKNAFSTTNTTDSAITSIQTGKYPLSHGVINHGKRVTDTEKQAVKSVPQITELLSNAGYQTAKFGRPLGRWHRNGFDRYPVITSGKTAFDHGGRVQRVKDYVKSASYSLHPKLGDIVTNTYRGLQNRVRSTSTGTERVENDGGDKIIDNFSEFVSECNRPFYSFVHLMDTHLPYLTSKEHVLSNLARFSYPEIPVENLKDTVATDSITHEKLQQGGTLYETAQQCSQSSVVGTSAVIDAHYDAAVQDADDRVGNLINALERADCLDETLLIVMADHGESLTEHEIYYDHHGLYDVTIRVPMILRPPGGHDGIIDEFIQVTDVAPTIASYAGVGGLNTDGVSLKSVIETRDEIDREFVIAEEAHTQRNRMIRTQEFKLIYQMEDDSSCRYCEIEHGASEELYDLSNDPDEKQNMADEHLDRVSELRQKVNDEISQWEASASSEDGVIDYDDESEIYERLEKLGYR